MDNRYVMFAVDDTEPALILLESAFAQESKMMSFSSAEDCLEYLNENLLRPNIFLLDVDMPGMDGYSLCQQIRQYPELEHVPVIFVSSLDDLDSRLKGYDSGGNDYVVKPYAIAELKQKVQSLLQPTIQKALLERQIADSEFMTNQILSNLDEYAVLLKFTRALNECESIRGLAGLIFNMLRGYHLDGAVQFRIMGTELTIGTKGDNQPFEVAVMNHVREMDRIFEFKTRAAYNFEYMTLLVNDMPVGDPVLCGRLRDHLAIAAECANAKLLSLSTENVFNKLKDTATEVVNDLHKTIDQIDASFGQIRMMGNTFAQNLLDELAQIFASLGLSEIQEESIDEVVRRYLDSMVVAFDSSADIHALIDKIAVKIGEIQTTEVRALSGHEQHVMPVSQEPSEPPSSVELF